MKSIEIVLCIACGMIFLISSVPKLRHPKGFILTVLEYQILPPPLGYLYGWVLPPLECLVALLLLTGTAIVGAAVTTAFLLLSFVVAISSNILRGRDLDCQCFGAKVQRKIGWPLVFEDCLLLSAVVIVAFLV